MSGAADWLTFEDRWNARLAKDGIQYMHMHEYVSSQHQFKGWSAEKKRTTGQALMADLVEIIQAHVYRKFGSVIFSKHMTLLDPVNRLSFSVDKCIALVGGHAASDVRKWAMREHLSMLPRLVFEKGDYGTGDLIKRLADDGWPVPAFEPKRDDVDKSGFLVKAFVPLQAADMVAHTYGDIGKEVESSADGTFDESRKWRFQQFEKIPGEIAPYSEESLKKMNESMNVLRVQEEWAKSKGLRWKQ
jgi:hypothetical protein